MGLGLGIGSKKQTVPKGQDMGQTYIDTKIDKRRHRYKTWTQRRVGQDKTRIRQEKTKQDKTRPDQTRQDKTGEDERRQGKARRGKAQTQKEREYV